MHNVPTVKIMPSDPEQGEFVVINEADFDPKVHKPYKEPKSKAPTATDTGDGAEPPK